MGSFSRRPVGRDVEGPVPGLLGHTQSSSEIDRRYRREPLCDLDQLGGNSAPSAGILHAAATVRVNANNCGATVLDELLKFVDLEQRDTELRMNAGSLDVFMMTTTLSGIHTYKDLAA